MPSTRKAPSILKPDAREKIVDAIGTIFAMACLAAGGYALLVLQ